MVDTNTYTYLTITIAITVGNSAMWKSGKKSKKIKPDIKIFLNKVFFGYSLYRYKYICCTIHYPCQMKRRNRRTYNGRHGDYFSLDQQNVNCGHNSIITSFVLKRFRATSWYKYDYCKFKFGRQKCTNHSTGFTIDGKGNYPLFGSSTCHMSLRVFDVTVPIATVCSM